MPTPLATMVRKVATCRLMLGIIAIVAVYADPTEPGFLPGLKLRGGGFAIDPYALAVLSAHLGYSLVVYWVAHREGVSPFDILQPAYAGLYSGAIHPTAEAHAIVADHVMRHVRAVLDKESKETAPVVAKGVN